MFSQVFLLRDILSLMKAQFVKALAMAEIRTDAWQKSESSPPKGSILAWGGHRSMRIFMAVVVRRDPLALAISASSEGSQVGYVR
jgi:hypothetical protein